MKPNRITGRKWEERLTAPKEVVDFYKAMDLVHRLGLFQMCHIYEGRAPSCVPLRGPQLCATLGCINPRHWANQRHLPEGQRIDYAPEVTDQDMRELRDYYLQANPGMQCTFEAFRALIPE